MAKPEKQDRSKALDQAKAREVRSAEALRANLRRRKSQERARTESGAEAPDPDAPAPAMQDPIGRP